MTHFDTLNVLVSISILGRWDRKKSPCVSVSFERVYIKFSERRESLKKRTVAMAMALVGVYPQYRSCRLEVTELIKKCP